MRRTIRGRAQAPTYTSPPDFTGRSTMRRFERVAVFGGVVLAILIALGSRSGGAAAMARTPDRRADQDFRLATVDIYTAIEKIMSRSDLKKAREDVASAWQAKAHA